MHRVLVALAALVFLCGQTPMLPGFPPGTFQNRAALDAGSSGCADSDVIAWKAAVITAGGTVSTGQETNVCTLVGSLKSHSLFSIQDRIWLHASENTQQATIDLVARAAATPVSSPSFTANQGYTGNGSSSYLDTNYSSGTNYTQNSGAISTYVRTSRTSGANYAEIGRYDAASTGTQDLIDPQTGGNLLYNVNNGPFANFIANSDAQGFWTASRTGASAIAIYKNSSSTAVASATTASSSPASNSNMYILAMSQNNSATRNSADQVAITVIGAGLSGANTAQMQTDFNTYMAAIGSNVYP